MESTRDRILNTALELFAEKGYSAVGTKRIAAAASVNEVTIFRIFRSKRNLFLEVYRKFSVKFNEEEFLKDIQYILEQDLVRIGRSFSRIYKETNDLIRISMKDVRDEFQEISDDLNLQIDMIRNAIAAYFREMEKRGLIRADCESLAAKLSGVLYGYAFHLSKTGTLSRLETDLDDLMRIFAKGLSN